MSPLPGDPGAVERRRAVLRLAFGQAQIVGATIALVLLLSQGITLAVFVALGITGCITVLSALLFRFRRR